MKSQLSAEFMIIVAMVLGLLVLIISVVQPSFLVPKNNEFMLHKQNLKSEDIGVINYGFNSTNGFLYLKNNLDYPINLSSVLVDDLDVISGYVLNPQEQHKFIFNHNFEIGEFYELNLEINFIDLLNNLQSGFSVILIGEPYN